MQFRVQNYGRDSSHARVLIKINRKRYPCIFNFEEESVLVRNENTKKVKEKIIRELSVLGWNDITFVDNTIYKRLSKQCTY